jgi:hypothetical protein
MLRRLAQTHCVTRGAHSDSYWSMYGGRDMTMKKMVDPMSFYKGALDESGMCTDYGGCKAETPVRTCTFAGGQEIPPWVAGAVWDFFKKL